MTGPLWGLAMGIFWTLGTGSSASVAIPIWLAGGLAFGACFGLAMARRFQGESASVPSGAHDVFVRRLDVATAEIAFFPESRTVGYYVYKPSFHAGLLAGRIAVSVGEDRATIVGPTIYVRRLLKRLQRDLSRADFP